MAGSQMICTRALAGPSPLPRRIRFGLAERLRRRRARAEEGGIAARARFGANSAVQDVFDGAWPVVEGRPGGEADEHAREREMPDTAPGLSYAWEAVFAANRERSPIPIPKSSNCRIGIRARSRDLRPRSAGLLSTLRARRSDSDQKPTKRRLWRKSAKRPRSSQDKPLTFLLEMNSKFGEPVWRVVWGRIAGHGAGVGVRGRVDGFVSRYGPLRPC